MRICEILLQKTKKQRKEAQLVSVLQSYSQVFKWQISRSGLKLFRYTIGYCMTRTDDHRK